MKHIPNVYNKMAEDTLQKTIVEFPRMMPYKPCTVVTGSRERRPFLKRLFQACKDFPEDEKPLIAKVITKDDLELMDTALGNVFKGPAWSCQSSRQDFTYHSDAPQCPQLPLKNHCLKLVTTLPKVSARQLKDVKVFMGINCDAPSNLENILEHKEEQLQQFHLSNSFLSGPSIRSHQTPLILKMVNKSCSHTSEQEEEERSQALREYCRSICVNWSPCGMVVHPNIPWLGALPHGMVYDPKEDPMFGLVHISCSSLQSFMACPFLSFENGVVRLKTNALHYWHIQGELMVTGMSWCDLVVVAKDDILVQRIYRDRGTIEGMKKKLDIFYFHYYLPSIKKNGK
ncbi:uncharacterized protein LOC129186099 isoform X2 [Dunckerocampus dactyliophorus]|uniref:uncharacterized protein LOC129186099 isoform X2 n=1 Tax=Dunckerocampus dactyliophorus TaxID=161453 RepID=UPI0024075127|nr:uncharacterized protein LOC129186099 isoform X2 [Dunckerocampus dactyliophorus]